jgi:hypothetical protein
VRAAVLAAAMLVVCSLPAAAQPYIGSSGPRAGSIEVGGSATWTAGYDAGSRAAQETANSSTGGPPITLFNTTSEVRPAIGVDGRVGIYLASRVSAEATIQFSRPALETRVSDDFENATPITAEATFTSYLIGGSLLYHFGSGRVVPFVSGGGGYLRQLHEDNADVVTGSEFHGGGGVKIWMGTGANRFGLRIDAQASSRSNSISFEEKRRIVPSVGFGFTYLF